MNQEKREVLKLYNHSNMDLTHVAMFTHQPQNETNFIIPQISLNDLKFSNDPHEET